MAQSFSFFLLIFQRKLSYHQITTSSKIVKQDNHKYNTLLICVLLFINSLITLLNNIITSNSFHFSLGETISLLLFIFITIGLSKLILSIKFYKHQVLGVFFFFISLAVRSISFILNQRAWAKFQEIGRASCRERV